MKFRQFFGYVLLLSILVGGFLAFQNRQQISDWLYLRGYQPSPIVESLASQSGMSDKGTNLFYVSNPKLNTKAEFNQNCEFPDRSLVLGCYDGTNIFILDIEQADLEGVEEVTAAHEMLHAAYIRLNSSEKQRVDSLLNDQYRDIDSNRIIDLIEEYRQQDPTVVSNELHSILATEYRFLSDELEEYYAQYFDSRLMVLVASEGYEAVFVSIDASIEKFNSQLINIGDNISAMELIIASQKSQLDTQRSILDGLIAQNKIQSYNTKVPVFNALVSSYNVNVEELKVQVDRYNSIVSKRNAIAIEQNELIQSLDSNYQPL